MMKTFSIPFFILMIVLFGFKESEVKEVFTSMHFVRNGGGQIDFSVYPENNNKLKVVVQKYNFRDTSIQIILNKNTGNASIFVMFNKAINNQIQLNGDSKQPTLPTGTWTYIYLVSNSKETEVTNIELLDTLGKFEQLVRSNIKNKSS